MNNSEITERNGPTTQMSEVAENNHNWKCANNGYLKPNNEDAIIQEQVKAFFTFLNQENSCLFRLERFWELVPWRRWSKCPEMEPGHPWPSGVRSKNGRGVF